MSFATLLALAVALAMDATAVAAARGLAARAVRPVDALRVALLFGGAQAVMPALGWLAGARFASRIVAWDHWLVFALLGGIGCKMIYEAQKAPDAEGADASATAGNDRADVFAARPLAVLAFATSIDALAAGVTLAMLDVNVVFACAVIGAVTAALSGAGVYAGRAFGARIGKRLDVVGGVVLVGLAVKTLFEHLYAAG